MEFDRLIADAERVGDRFVGQALRQVREDVEEFLRTHSTRPQVRQAMFDRVMRIAQSNPDLSSDDVLDVNLWTVVHRVFMRLRN